MPTLPNTVLVAPAAFTTTGLLELQVSGTPVKVIPRLSVTVALSVVEAPVLTRNEVCELSRALIEIDWTGQVVNCNGELFTPPALAKKEVTPGSLAVAICWFKHAPCCPFGHCVLPDGREVRETAFV